MSLKRVSTKKDVKPRIASQTVPSQYPSKWFDDHPGCKPPLNIILKTADLIGARKMLKKAIADGTVDASIANTFLYYYAQKLEMTMEEVWISYKVTICELEGKITPLSFFEVKTETVLSNKATTEASENDDPWMAGYVLSQYRMLKIVNPTHQASTLDRIKGQLQGLTDATFVYSDQGDKYRGWMSNKIYNKLVAAYDMFFHRFPEHPLAPLRICTTRSRHRDCAGLTSYGYLVDILGMRKATDVMDWVFLESIANDIDRLMAEDDELNVTYSYFPYQVDFGLVSKFSYSATINPCFFEWTHIIGSIMGAQRSLNARHITDKQSSEIFANAACVAYVYNFNFEFTKAYTDDGEPIAFEEDEDSDEETDDHDEVLKSKDPTDWLTIIRSLKGNLPKKVRDFIKGAGQAIKDPRPGSISEHFQKKAHNKAQNFSIHPRIYPVVQSRSAV